jgi:hypothetical protein
MINGKRLSGTAAATGVAVIEKAEAQNPVIDWNDTAIRTGLTANRVTFARLSQRKVRTMSRKQLWKPFCGLLVLLLIPLTGRSDVVQDWDAIMQATVNSQPPSRRLDLRRLPNLPYSRRSTQSHDTTSRTSER